MTKRKSIVSAFGDFRGDDKSNNDPATESNEDQDSRPKRVAAGIIGSTQRTLTQIREERDALMEQVVSGNHITKLSPNIIDPSPFRDRLPDDNNIDFEHFIKSLREEGQKVPITVRPNPQRKDRYQIVYGHRRWRALKELGVEVDAVIAEYSDRDLVIAQGIENAGRQDLTWIERALFANEMQTAGIKPRDIKASLSVEDSELSKFRSVLKVLPTEIIEKIGRAPNVGRPRWLEFASRIQNKTALEEIKKTLADAKVSNATSDEKFVAAFSAVGIIQQDEDKNNDELLNVKLGQIGSISMKNSTVKISLTKDHSVAFRKFFKREMNGLIERYLKSQRDE